MIEIVSPDGVMAIWPEIEGYLKDAMKGTIDMLFHPVDLLAGIIRNEWTLWIAKEGNRILAAMLTRLSQYPRARACHIFLIGGTDLDKWADEFQAKVEEYARRNGCSRMEAGGRQGWVRVGNGYHVTGQLIAKELT
jgi:hypothetical protein